MKGPTWSVWAEMPTQTGTEWVAVDEGPPGYCQEGAQRRNATAVSFGVDARFTPAPTLQGPGQR